MLLSSLTDFSLLSLHRCISGQLNSFIVAAVNRLCSARHFRWCYAFKKSFSCIPVGQQVLYKTNNPVNCVSCFITSVKFKLHTFATKSTV